VHHRFFRDLAVNIGM